MNKLPRRVTALTSTFLIFFLTIRSPLVKLGDTQSEGSASCYECEAVKKSAPLRILSDDRIDDHYLGHYETENKQVKPQNDFHIREGEAVPHISHSGQKSVMERGLEESASENDTDISRAPEYSSSSSSALATVTTTGNPLQKALRRTSLGSHPLPPKSAFISRPGAHWVTFFHDQAVAAVLLSDNATIFDCIVQEVIKAWEQREALEYLGEIMPLQPADLPFMVHLSTLCGLLNTPAAATRPAGAGSINFWSQGLSVLQGILPGTLWCGRSDQAVNYRHLGVRAALDSCCRTHDHCPVKLLPMTSRYGLTNISLKTRSHCLCDLEFYRCLKAAAQFDPLAATVGEVYFNVLKMDCLRTGEPEMPTFVPDTVSSSTAPSANSQKGQVSPHTSATSTLPPRMECSRRDSNGGCRMWLLNPRGTTTRLHFAPFNIAF